MRRRGKDGGQVFEATVLVPPHLRRPFIYSGYRYELSARQCVHSLFRMHNETVGACGARACRGPRCTDTPRIGPWPAPAQLNIWSHIVGFALFLGAHALDAACACTSFPEGPGPAP